MKKLLLAGTHAAAIALGFALGIYLLPIISAPEGPTAAEVEAAAEGALFSTAFRRDLAGSDLLHWGEGAVTVGRSAVTFTGNMAPGPAYRLYLVPEPVETAEEFLRLKARSAALGEIRTFDGFVVPVPASIDVSAYRAVAVWCEAFSQFITAAAYR